MGSLLSARRLLLPEAKLSNRPDGRARALDGWGLHGGSLKAKLLAFPILCNLALASVGPAPPPMKVPGDLSVGELPTTGPPGKEPLGKERRVRREIMQPYIQPSPPPIKTPLPKGRVAPHSSQPGRGTDGFEIPALATKECIYGYK